MIVTSPSVTTSFMLFHRPSPIIARFSLLVPVGLKAALFQVQELLGQNARIQRGGAKVVGGSHPPL
jgi:hypothetical protein